MKLKDLLERKDRLKNEIHSLGSKMSQLGQELQEKDLESFIANGNLPPMDGHKIQKLRNQHKYLLTIAVALDKEILVSSQREKEKAKSRMERQVNELTRVRGKLKKKVIYLLEKAEVLREESRGIHSEEDELRSLLNIKENPTTRFVFRLNLMEKFLAEHIVLGSGEEQISEEVLKARKHNQEVLAQPTIGINDFIFRNFTVEQDTKTLQVLKFELDPQDAQAAVRNLDRKGSLTKAEFLKERC